MKESVRLGQIAGVRVGMNWSVLVIFVLIAFGLAAGQLPLVAPGYEQPVYVAAGLASAVVFLFSLLAHEVSHAVVARRNGLEVEGITLWLFGGVARLGGDPDDAGADLRIAGVGPLVSLVLGAGFFALSGVLGGLGVPELAVAAVSWLAIINVVLAVFNLVPAAPLDGGRVLRALLWRRSGDRYAAAITASRAGRIFGFVLVGVGLFQFVFAEGIGGLWLVLIGWFIVNAAGAEEQHNRIRGALGHVRVRDVMSPDPTTAPEDLTVEQFLDGYVFRSRYSAFPLVRDGHEPVGLVTLNRVKGIDPEERATTSVADIACPAEEVPTATPDEPLADLLERMRGCTDGRALVIDEGRLVGIVSPTDVARRLEIAELRNPSDAEHV